MYSDIFSKSSLTEKALRIIYPALRELNNRRESYYGYGGEVWKEFCDEYERTVGRAKRVMIRLIRDKPASKFLLEVKEGLESLLSNLPLAKPQPS